MRDRMCYTLPIFCVRMVFKTRTIHEWVRPERKAGMVAGMHGLLLHRFVLQIGVGLFGLFAPIYIYEITGYRLWVPILMSVAFYILCFLFQPLVAPLITRWGMKRSMVVATGFFALYYYILSLREVLPLPTLLISSVLVAAIYHLFYWLPYHIELVESTTKKKRGRMLGYIAAVTSIVGMVTPLIGGFSIRAFGYHGIIIASFCFLLGSIPFLFTLKTIPERYSFGYIETFRVLFAQKNRLMFFVYAIEGAENIVGSLFWPLFLFHFFQGNYIAIGINAALIVTVGCMLEIIMGFVVEKRDSRPLLRYGVGLSAVGWLLKALITTVSQVVFASVFHTFALIIERIPFQALMYARAADAGHYVDEYTVLREMALCVGRILMLLLCLMSVSLLGFSSVFFLAALATLGFSLITRLQSRAPLLAIKVR